MKDAKANSNSNYMYNRNFSQFYYF